MNKLAAGMVVKRTDKGKTYFVLHVDTVHDMIAVFEPANRKNQKVAKLSYWAEMFNDGRLVQLNRPAPPKPEKPTQADTARTKPSKCIDLPRRPPIDVERFLADGLSPWNTPTLEGVKALIEWARAVRAGEVLHRSSKVQFDFNKAALTIKKTYAARGIAT